LIAFDEEQFEKGNTTANHKSLNTRQSPALNALYLI